MSNQSSNGVQPRLHWLKDEIAKTVFRWSVVLVVGLAALIFAPIGDQVMAVWNTPHLIEKIEADASKREQKLTQEIEKLSKSIGDLTREVRKATGEDRIIRQPAGLSYVEEPVVEGEDITVMLVLARTELGLHCRFIGGQSMFRDTLGIKIPGSKVTPQQQLTTQEDRLRVPVTPSPILTPGRIELYFILDYMCGDKLISEKTDVMTYRLLQRGEKP